MSEEDLDAITSLIGDGNASVTPGVELKTSDFGNAAMVSCYVRLTCNQDTATIEKALDLGVSIARSFVEREHVVMKRALDHARGKAPVEDMPVKKTLPVRKVKRASSR